MPQQIIIFGNTTTGAGKTATLAQIAIALLRLGRTVGTLDLDEDHDGLTNFLDRRRAHDTSLPQPGHHRLPANGRDEKTLATALTLTLADMAAAHDIILIDTPSTLTPLARLAHGFADIVVTPVRGDDYTSLATLKNNTARIEKPAPYAEMLEDHAIRHHARGAAPAQWLALRSRAPIKPISNKRQSVDILDKISGTFGFSPVAGLHERPLYNDLFAKGLTLFDQKDSFDMSALAARQEVRSLIHAITPGTAAPVKDAV